MVCGASLTLYEIFGQKNLCNMPANKFACVQLCSTPATPLLVIYDWQKNSEDFLTHSTGLLTEDFHWSLLDPRQCAHC